MEVVVTVVMNNWQQGRCQPQNVFELDFLIVTGVYFHSDFCGCLKRHTTLISYNYFAISSQVATGFECDVNG